MKKNHSLPFIVLFIVGASIAIEAYTGTPIHLEQYMPVLIALGIGGAAKTAITRAAAVRKQLPADIGAQIRAAVREANLQGTRA